MKGSAVYLDDIIIGGRKFREHFDLLKEVLERLRAAGLTVKSSKVSCKRSLFSSVIKSLLKGSSLTLSS